MMRATSPLFRFCPKTGLPLSASGFINPFHTTDDRTKRTFHHLLNRNLAHTLALLEIPHFDPEAKKVTTTDFFPKIDRLVMERTPDAKMFVYGGVVRSMLGYLYSRLYAEHMKNPGRIATKQLLEEFLEESAKLSSLDVLGIGSDLDLLWDPSNSSDSVDTIAPALKAFIDAYLNTLPKTSLSRLFALFGDVLKYDSQVRRSSAQGGSPLDWLAFPITPRSGDGIRHAPGYPDTIDQFLEGRVHFERTNKDHPSHLLTLARQFRPLLEIPFLDPSKESLHQLIQDARALSENLDGNIAKVFKKAVRNVRHTGVCNYFAVPDASEDALRKAVRALSRKQSPVPLIPEFLPFVSIEERSPDFDPGNLRRDEILLSYDDFIEKYTDQGVLYHGTPDTKAMVQMMRTGIVVSTEQSDRSQGSAAYGRGFYMTENPGIAKEYAGKHGVSLGFCVIQSHALRVLDLDHLPKTILDRFRQEAGNSDLHEYLQKTYAIDIIIHTHVLVQNASAIQIPKNIEEWGRAILQNYEEQLISLCNPITFMEGKAAEEYINKLCLADSLITSKGTPSIIPNISRILASQFLNTENKIAQAMILRILSGLVNQGYGYEKTMVVVNFIFKKQTDLSMKIQLLPLLKALIEKGQGYKEATEAAAFIIKNNSNKNLQWESLLLFQVLVEKGQGYKEATEAAAFIIKNSSDQDLQRLALKLFEALVEKEKEYKEAAEAAAFIVKNSKNLLLCPAAFSLFQTLVRKGQKYQEATEAAVFVIKSKDHKHYQQFALKLFQALVKKEQGYPEAAEAAAFAITNSSDKDIQGLALYLFSALVEKEQGYQEATKAAAFAIKNSDDKDLRKMALYLFQALVKKRQGYQEAIEAAAFAINSDDKGLRQSALDLFYDLVKKEQGFQEATEAAALAIKNSDDKDLRKMVLYLFHDLVKKEQGYQEAAKAAAFAIKNSDDKDLQQRALALFRDLVEKGQGYQEATKAVAFAIKNSDDKDLQQRALSLFRDLVEKGQGYQEAADAAAFTFQNSNDEDLRRSAFILSRKTNTATQHALQTMREFFKKWGL